MTLVVALTLLLLGGVALVHYRQTRRRHRLQERLTRIWLEEQLSRQRIAVLTQSTLRAMRQPGQRPVQRPRTRDAQ